MTIPHLRFPLAIGADGGALTVEQDEPEDVAQCVAIIAMTVRGDRPCVPFVGVPDALFLRDTPVAALTDAIREWEPRADLTVGVAIDTVDPWVRKINLDVSVTQEPAWQRT